MLNLIIHNQSEDQKKAVDVIASENIRILEEAKTGENCYADSQGWLDTEEWAGEENIKRLEEIRENADAFVLIGVGGSNNAARSVIEALRKDDAPEIIYAGNTLSPDAMNRMMKRLEGKSIYIDCIAKNFETLEPGSSFRILRKYMEKTYGEEAGKRIIATGTVGSSLETLCTKYGYTFLEFPLNVGGRYTAMTREQGICRSVYMKRVPKRILHISMHVLEISTIKKDTVWRCFQALSLSSVSSINGGSSFLQKVKEKIIKESFRWQENFRRNCIQ